MSIPSTLQRLTVATSKLATYPQNPRRGDVEQIKRSLEQHGQYRPLVVNKRTMHVLAGNHTLLAARELGWDKVAVTYVDVDDEQAARIVLVDNRTADLALYDDDALAELLSSLDSLDGTGWAQDDLDELLQTLEDDEPLEADDDEHAGYTFDVYPADAIIDAAFAHYRRVGFPYRSLPLHVAMSEINALAAMRDDKLVRTRVGHHVADTYQPHRWHAHVDGAPNAVDVFESDEKLRIALRHVLDYGYTWSPTSFSNLLGLTHGAQGASNFRPGYALLLLRRHAPAGGVVLDSSTGYGGRLVGFLASTCSTYIGVDPASETHAGNERLARDLCPDSKSVELLCLPAEDVQHDVVRERCDVAITSPPYFRKEHYADEATQSFKRYGTPNEWRAGFLRPMLELQHVALRPGGISVVNIADVTIRGQRDAVPLVEWTLEEARAVGFELVATDSLPLMRRWGPQVEGVASEPVLVFRKPA